MPTAACGINCDVCKLNLLGTCSSCGPGTSLEAEKKIGRPEPVTGQSMSDSGLRESEPHTILSARLQPVSV